MKKLAFVAITALVISWAVIGCASAPAKSAEDAAAPAVEEPVADDAEEPAAEEE